jgi:3-phosphoglycerate kinase
MVEVDKIQIAKDGIRKAKETGTKLLLPVNHIVASSLNAGTNTIGSTSHAELNIPDGTIEVGIRLRTIELFEKEINEVSTILWNGLMGIFKRQ